MKRGENPPYTRTEKNKIYENGDDGASFQFFTHPYPLKQPIILFLEFGFFFSASGA